MKKRWISLVMMLVLVAALIPALTTQAEATTNPLWPVPGHTHLSQGYHNKNAIDINDESIAGAEVVAAMDGTVKYVFRCAEHHDNEDEANGCPNGCLGFGNGVVIIGVDGRAYQYAHMEADSIPSNVYEGAAVERGQVIGKVGGTGWAFGVHLHFGISYTQNHWEPGPNPDPEVMTYDYYIDKTAPTIVDNTVYCSEPDENHDLTISLTVRDDHALTEAKAVVWKYGDTEEQGKPYYSTIGEFQPDTDVPITIDVHLNEFNIKDDEGIFYWKVCLSDGTNDTTYSVDDKTNTTQYVNLFQVMPDQEVSGNYKVISDAPCRIAPYEKWNGKDTSNHITALEGSVVECVGKYYNGYKHDWYLTNQGDWIYGDHLTKYTNWMEFIDRIKLFFGNPIYWMNGQPVATYKISTDIPTKGAEFKMVEGDRHITQPWETPVEDPTGSTAVIYFDANGGYCSKGSYTYDAGAAYGWLPTASSYGEQFLGWFTERSGGTKVSERSTCAASGTTLYAHWAPASQTAGMCGKNVQYALYDGGVLVISGTGAMYDDWGDGTYSSPFKNDYSIQEIVIEPGVTSIGANAFNSCISLKWVTIPETVTSMGDYAFRYCRSLTEVTIPESVTSIGCEILSHCTGLTKLTMPGTAEIKSKSDGNSTFYNCPNIQEVILTGHGTMTDYLGGRTGLQAPKVTIREGLTSIGKYAFRYWNSLAEVTIPSSVTSIGDNAFSGCTGLTEVTIPSSVTSIGKSAFSGCTGLTEMTIPSSVTSIGAYVVSGCTNLTKVTMVEGVTSIGAKAFMGCSGLAEVMIPGSVTSIGEYAFSGCTGLTKVTFLEGITSIGNSAFSGCKSLREITTPGSVTSIGEYAFSGCTGLTKATLLEGITSIEDSAFNGCSSLMEVTIPSSVTSIEGLAFAYCSSLAEVTIPENVTCIRRGAFRNCDGLTKLTMPGTAEIKANIGADASFYSCPNIQEVILTGHGEMHSSLGNGIRPGARPWSQNESVTVTIREGLTSICDCAFWECPGLVQISIPESVTSIGNYAFEGCSGLTEITIPESVTSIGDSAFRDCVGLTKVTMPGTAKIVATTYTSYEGQTSFYHCPNIQEVILTGHGEMRDTFKYYEEGTVDRPWSQNESVTVTIQDGLTSISDYAFYECPGLVRVTIPESVTSIGKNAFSGCSGLTEVLIPEGVTDIEHNTFSGCSGLTELTIPEGVTSIGTSAFSGCTGLTKLTMPGTAEMAIANGSYASFYDCPNIQEVILTGHGMHARQGNGIRPWSQNESVTVTIQDGLTSICDDAFYDCPGLVQITIPSSVTSIGEEAFRSCTGLKEITIPESVASIGEGAFYSCTGLTNIEIPDSVTSIGNYAFGHCYSLTNIEIPENVTSLGNGAFYGCIGLTTIEIPESITTIGDWTFNNCTGLTNIEIPESVTSLGNGAFYGCSSLKHVNIPEGITSIGYSTFYDCTGLTEIEIPEGVTSIGKWAFCNCSSLMNLSIPEGVTSIEEAAFQACSSLASVTIPDSVASIESMAFSYCYNLKDVYYGGSEEQWNAIHIEGGNEEITEGYQATIHYASGTPITITTQPKDYVGKLNATATFTVAAEGNGLTYQWQFRDDDGIWTNSSVKTARYSTKLTTAKDGRQVRCIVTNAEGKRVASAVAVMKLAGPAITTQPKDYTGKLNSTAIFTVAAEGEGLTYQWQISDNGVTWTNSSVKAAKYSTKLTADKDGRQVRCIVTNAEGGKTTSEVATMKLPFTGITIITQPEYYVGKLNSTARFTVVAEGNGLTYQWQISDNNGKTWSNSSVKRAVYTTKLTAEKDGRAVRCIVKDANGDWAITDVATMRIQIPHLSIITHPKDYTGKLNSIATFTVEAEGEGLTYQWWISDDYATTWTMSSVKKAVYTTKLTAEKNGRVVRCDITDANGYTVSTRAALMRIG